MVTVQAEVSTAEAVPRLRAAADLRRSLDALAAAVRARHVRFGRRDVG